MSILDTSSITYYDNINFYFQDRIDSVIINNEKFTYAYLNGKCAEYQYSNGNCMQYIHNYWDRGTPFPYPFVFFSDTIKITYNAMAWNKYVPHQYLTTYSGLFEYGQYYEFLYYLGFNDINNSLANQNLIATINDFTFEYSLNTKNQITKVTTYNATTGEKIGYVTLEYYP